MHSSLITSLRKRAARITDLVNRLLLKEAKDSSHDITANESCEKVLASLEDALFWWNLRPKAFGQKKIHIMRYSQLSWTKEKAARPFPERYASLDKAKGFWPMELTGIM